MTMLPQCGTKLPAREDGSIKQWSNSSRSAFNCSRSGKSEGMTENGEEVPRLESTRRNFFPAHVFIKNEWSKREK